MVLVFIQAFVFLELELIDVATCSRRVLGVFFTSQWKLGVRLPNWNHIWLSKLVILLTSDEVVDLQGNCKRA